MIGPGIMIYRQYTTVWMSPSAPKSLERNSREKARDAQRKTLLRLWKFRCGGYVTRGPKLTGTLRLIASLTPGTFFMILLSTFYAGKQLNRQRSLPFLIFWYKLFSQFLFKTMRKQSVLTFVSSLSFTSIIVCGFWLP